MSRGPGRVQRELIDALLTGETFTVEELAAWVFPGDTHSRARRASIWRALANLPLSVQKQRVGTWGVKGWHYRFRLT